MACVDCFSGSVHEGQSRGKVIKLHGLDAYVSEPSGARPVRGVIVIIPDAFGWEFANPRILADHYADKGDYKVYLPDFMIGGPAPVSMLDRTKQFHASGNYLVKIYHLLFVICSFAPFIFRNRPGKVYPIVRGFFEQLRKDEGATLPIGAAGFCWGGKFTLLLSHGAEMDGKPLIDAGFTGHPSLLSIPGDIDKIVRPVSFAIPEKDSFIPSQKAEQIKAIVEAKPDGARGEVRVYKNAGHGFCVRADPMFSDVAEQAAEAEDQCIAWFDARFRRDA